MARIVQFVKSRTGRLLLGIIVAGGLVALLASPYSRRVDANVIRRIQQHYAMPIPGPQSPLSNVVFVCFDVETTGVNHNYDRVVELGAAKYVNGRNVGERHWMVNPGQFVSAVVQDVHGIGPDALRDEREFVDIYPEFAEFIAGAVLLAHNANFDVNFVRTEALRAGYPIPPNPTIDTMQLFRRVLPGMPNYRVATIANHYGLEGGEFHRALDDVIYTVEAFFRALQEFGPDVTLGDVYRHAGNLVYFQVEEP